MRLSLPALLAIVLASVPAAAQPPAADAQHEEILMKLFESLSGIVKSLEMITDEVSAKAQQPELKTLAQTFLSTRKLSESLPPPSNDQRDRLARAYRPLFEQNRKALLAQIARVQRVPGGLAALQEIRAVFERSPLP